MAATESLTPLRRAILGWYRSNSRSLPWRKTRDPYRVLVSEVMLQQTQADRVASLYPTFLSKYPTVEALADASRSDVIRAWKGLGYNNRAVRLHAAVKEIRSAYGGRVPDDIGDLDALPGIGKYTSHAVTCFAHGRRTPLVDVNVLRVLSRIFHRMKTPGDLLGDGTAWEIAERILPRGAYTWNQALMELGARVCTARAPRCDVCPVGNRCASSASLRRTAAKGGRTPRTPSEPSHFGVPRRVWRGRVIEHLRGAGRPVTVPSLRRALLPGKRNGSTRWLETVLAHLERDGLVTIGGSGSRLTVDLAA